MRINRERLIENINRNWSTKNCPMCGGNNWAISDDVMAMMRVGENNDIMLGGRITPVVPVICNECGNTVLINPIVARCTED